TDTLVINGRAYTSVFNQTAKTITTTTPAGRISTVTLDTKGRVIQEQVTGLEPVSYTYDTLGRLSTITQGTGATARTFMLSYDTGGRLSMLTLPGNLTIGYAYSSTTGNLSSITTPDSTLAYTYDGSLLNTTTWAGTVAGSVDRVYDANFRLITQSVNGANTVSFGYDNDSLLTSAG